MVNRTNTDRQPDPDTRRREIDATARQIERTTADLRETVTVLQDRLAPDHVAAHMKESIREATVGRAEDAMADVTYRARHTTNTIVDTIWDNPLPAALAAIGIGWLFKESRRRESFSQRTDYPRYGSVSGNVRTGWSGSPGDFEGLENKRARLAHRDDECEFEEPKSVSASLGDTVRDRVTDTMEQTQRRAGEFTENAQEMVQGKLKTGREAISDLAETGREALSDLAETGRETISDLSDMAETGRETISDLAETAQQKAEKVAATGQEVIGQVTGQMRERMTAVSQTAQQQARYAQRTFDRTLHQSPFGLAALAFGVGAAVGLMAPPTQTERRLLGDTSSKFLGQAEETVQKTFQQTADKVQQFMDSGQQDMAQKDGTSQPSSSSSGPKPSAQPSGGRSAEQAEPWRGNPAFPWEQENRGTPPSQSSNASTPPSQPSSAQTSPPRHPGGRVEPGPGR